MTDRPSALPRYTHPLLAEDPESFGSYLLLARVATGTTGTVYLSRDSSGAWVAVRALHPGHARRTDLRARFAAAVTRANRVSGRGTCAVVDTAVEAEVPYVVFEFVDGPTLATEVGARGPLAVGELHQMARDLAGAVASLHQARVVHGALEPSDVVLSVTGTRLVDLATSRALVSLLPSEPRHDLVLAPEVRTRGEAGSAADVFGWASLVWFAATGRPVATVAGRLPTVPGLDDTLGKLLSGASRDDPAARPTAADLVARLAPAPRNGRRGKLGAAAVSTGAVGPISLTPPTGFPPPQKPGARPPAPPHDQPPPTSPRARPAAAVTAVFGTPSQPADDEPTSHRGKRALLAGAVFLAVAASAAAVAPAVSASGGSDSVETAAETDVSSGPSDFTNSDVPPPVLAASQSPTPGASSSAATDAAAPPLPSDSPSELGVPSIPLVALAPGTGDESRSDEPAAPPPVAADPEPAPAAEVVAIQPAPVVPMTPTTAPEPVPAAVPPPAPPQTVAPAATQVQPAPPQPYVAPTSPPPPPPPPPPPASPEPAVSPSPSGLTPKEVPVIQLTRAS